MPKQPIAVRHYPATKAEKQVWLFVFNYIHDNNYAPTQEEIAKGLRRTRGVVLWLLSSLERKGYLVRKDGIRRNIVLVENPDKVA